MNKFYSLFITHYSLISLRCNGRARSDSSPPTWEWNSAVPLCVLHQPTPLCKPGCCLLFSVDACKPDYNRRAAIWQYPKLPKLYKPKFVFRDKIVMNLPSRYFTLFCRTNTPFCLTLMGNDIPANIDQSFFTIPLQIKAYSKLLAQED